MLRIDLEVLGGDPAPIVAAEQAGVERHCHFVHGSIVDLTESLTPADATAERFPGFEHYAVAARNRLASSPSSSTSSARSVANSAAV